MVKYEISISAWFENAFLKENFSAEFKKSKGFQERRMYYYIDLLIYSRSAILISQHTHSGMDHLV